MESVPVFADLSDAQLIEEVARLTRAERESTVALIASLQEFDRRQLFLPAGYRSLFSYCTLRLGLSEGAAYSRIEAARAAMRFPIVLRKLADGSITLSTIGLLSRHLTPSNHLSLLDESCGKSKREVERIVAGLRPMPDAPTVIRKVPAAVSRTHAPAASVPPAPALATPVSFAVSVPSPALAPALSLSVVPRAVIAPLTPERFKLQVTMDRQTHDTLREIQDLMRHAVPDGDAAVIVARALKLLREHLLRQKAAQVTRPRVRNVDTLPGGDSRPGAGSSLHGISSPGTDMDSAPTSRYISAEVRRRVWERDRGQCAFAGVDGRCDARGLLEFHHVTPFAAGGDSIAQNIELRCRAHNAYEAELFFGTETSGRRRETG